MTVHRGGVHLGQAYRPAYRPITRPELVRSYRLSGTTGQNWMAASPGAGSNGNCTEIQLGVVVMAAALILPITRCEQWVVDKKNPAVDLRVDWFGPGTRNMREVGMELAVWVNQGAWPQWVLPADADGGVA